ncbi:hypothetical protein SAY87_002159 [Trapa incisa]|uniref:Uncharacterized protein n=1 Tax=Trapa incisa TaxID=236973 RepID=A0AAN7PYU2_9MYRT|nr:hypothetical protein SAY87_002159 [Trapa incisa]
MKAEAELREHRQDALFPYAGQARPSIVQDLRRDLGLSGYLITKTKPALEAHSKLFHVTKHHQQSLHQRSKALIMILVGINGSTTLTFHSIYQWP